ncbi:ARABIDOPSIS THALIANA OVATE FAMILY PROTEIN 3, ovate family protein 3 [Hibiscus trionum]|uniref:Transcription repressor n=1 Tax=Hibiscus trionum TaxID=183268 RepID=A0A9W7IGA6_HIBTR|nr:ARABIDOPSIS THALIANA OVATE FAMILY PROTEIN 3, ovate family protein 3 [Hibiscus trionum]
MGNYRFRLSDMIPNVWFYKLKGVGRTRRNHSSGGGGGGRDNNTRKNKNHGLLSPPASKAKQPQGFCPRKSYYFTRELVPSDFPDAPRKSSKQLSGKINPRKSTSGDRSNLQQELRSDCILTTEFSCKLMNSNPDDNNNVSGLKVELPPIKCRRSSVSVSVVKEERITVKETTKKNSSGVRKFTMNSPGVRLRVNSPRIASRRIQGRRSVSSSSSSLSGSFAVVKSSSDPQRDFRESMVEMIMENNIRESKDLEDLLACYLSLNSNEHHDVIVKVFKQIWFNLCDVRIK